MTVNLIGVTSGQTIVMRLAGVSDGTMLRKHFTYASGGILDDHTPLNKAGITTIDLIDFDFPAGTRPATRWIS